jgi:hypothetical protein
MPLPKQATKQRRIDFHPAGGRFVASIDLRTSPVSRLNAKAYRNANIANDRGILGDDTVIRTTGGQLFFSVQTLGDADLVADWVQLFVSNWGNSKL